MMVQMAGIDIDRLERTTSPSKFVAEMEDQWPGLYERLYSKGFQTTKKIIAELRRQTQSGSCAQPPAAPKKRIGKEAAAQNDS